MFATYLTWNLVGFSLTGSNPFSDKIPLKYPLPIFQTNPPKSLKNCQPPYDRELTQPFKNFASSCIFSVQPNINILYYNITQQFLSHSIKTRAASGYTQQPKTKQTRKKVGDTEKLPKLPNKKTDSLYYTLLK